MPANRHIKTAAAVALSLGVIAAPAASAHIPPPDPYCANCSSTVAHSPGSPVGAPGSPVGAQPTIVHVEPKSGFDWLDAGVGVAGGIALSIAGVGGALAFSQRRERGTQESTAAFN
jgi:hypothetical protein